MGAMLPRKNGRVNNIDKARQRHRLWSYLRSVIKQMNINEPLDTSDTPRPVIWILTCRYGCCARCVWYRSNPRNVRQILQIAASTRQHELARTD